MLVLAVDTSTPVVTAGVVRVLRPHEVVAGAGAGSVATGGLSAPGAPAVTGGPSATGGPAVPGGPSVPGAPSVTGGPSATGGPAVPGGPSVPGAPSVTGADPSTPAALPSPVELLAERTLVDAFGHAEHLMPLVGDALTESGIRLADIEAVVVGLGPGPFTGLRVGIATAQALGDARSLPVHGVPSHDGVASSLPGVDPEIGYLVATDARRREVYVSGYRGGVRRAGPLVGAPSQIVGLLPPDFRPSWIAGAGAGLLAPVLGLPVLELPVLELPVWGAEETAGAPTGRATAGAPAGRATAGAPAGRVPAGGISAGLVRAALRPLVTGAIPGPLTPLYLRRPDAAVPGAPKPVLPVGVSR